MFSLSRFHVFLHLLATGLLALGFDISQTNNLAVYWGQNSGGGQSTLKDYCQDDTITVIPIAFLYTFISTGGFPLLDLSNTCSGSEGVFPGTGLLNCQFLADDITTCQSKGKAITLSLGGATGSNNFDSDSQAEEFADTIWNLFLGGSSSSRPFGTAILDGIDLDIESGDSAHFPAFVNKLRTYTDGADKQYYLTAAPQCVYPDASIGTLLNTVAFDAIYVQYNNYCGLQSYNTSNWNFGTWDNWAKTDAINRDVKIYIGAPASSTAAGSGYVSASTLGMIAQETLSKYSSFGGIMLWDASSAEENDGYDEQIKALLNAVNTTADALSERFVKIAMRNKS